jgi:hypothetical protein
MSNEVMHLVARVGNTGALQDKSDRAMANLAIGGMFPVQERVDHRVLEMGPTPPRHERIGIAVPPFRCQERGCGLGQSGLHVDHGTVLVEHADLDESPHIIRGIIAVSPSPMFESPVGIFQLSFSEIPPSTTSSSPVTYFDSSEARYRQA